MASYHDLLDAIARVRSATGDPDAWKKGLTGDDVAAALNPASPPGALGAVITKLAAAHPDVFLSGGDAGPSAPPPRIGEGAAADAIRDAEGALARQNTDAAHVDLQVITAVLNAHAAHDEGLAELTALQRDIEDAVGTRTDLDTAAGAREFQRYLIGKLRDIRNVVENSSLDSTSKASLAAALSALYTSATPDPQDPIPAAPAPHQRGPGQSARVSPPCPHVEITGSATDHAPLPESTYRESELPMDALDLAPYGMSWPDPPLPAPPPAPVPAASPPVPMPAASPPVPAPMTPTPLPAIPAPPWGASPLGGAPVGGGLPGLLGGMTPPSPVADPPLMDLARHRDSGPTDVAADSVDEAPADAPPAPDDPADPGPPAGDGVTPLRPELAAAITAAVGGTPIPDAFAQQGISIPAPGTAVNVPLDPAGLAAGDIGMLTDRHALALGNGKALLDQQIQPIGSVMGPGFLGWQHPPPFGTGTATPEVPAPTRAAATAPS